MKIWCPQKKVQRNEQRCRDRESQHAEVYPQRWATRLFCSTDSGIIPHPQELGKGGLIFVRDFRALQQRLHAFLHDVKTMRGLLAVHRGRRAKVCVGSIVNEEESSKKQTLHVAQRIVPSEREQDETRRLADRVPE